MFLVVASSKKELQLLDSSDFMEEKDEETTFDFTTFNSDTLNFLDCYNNSTVFLQTMAQLDNELPALLRQPDRSFKAIFKRESAEGEGILLLHFLNSTEYSIDLFDSSHFSISTSKLFFLDFSWSLPRIDNTNQFRIAISQVTTLHPVFQCSSCIRNHW